MLLIAILGDFVLNHYAILCGSAPYGFTQKKINEMHDFLISSSGNAWAEKEIVFFPNGVDDSMLAFVLERLKADKIEQIFLYICTMSPVAEEDKSVWLGGYEVKKSLIEAFCADGRGQVIYDCGREITRNEKISYKEKVFSSNFQEVREW